MEKSPAFSSFISCYKVYSTKSYIDLFGDFQYLREFETYPAAIWFYEILQKLANT